MVCPSLSSAVESLNTPPLSTKIESVYVLGGSSIYGVSAWVLPCMLYNAKALTHFITHLWLVKELVRRQITPPSDIQ